MSLIQQALEKTNHVKETKTANAPLAPKAYDRDPMGAALEQELTQVQRSYIKRRRLYRKVSLGVLLVCFIAGISYVGVSQHRSLPAVLVPSAVSVLPAASAPPAISASPVASIPSSVLVSPAAGTLKLQELLNIVSGDIFHLTGIMSLGGKPMAVINEKIVGEGDSLSGKAVVKQIDDGKVRLDVHGKEVVLTL